jgi:serine/threonine-protein kinase
MNTPPSTLGQYQIIREIARSNDIVYEAYDPLMNRRVAVKELAMPSGASAQQKEERLQRFRREAQAAGTLNHPNIMTVYSFAEDAGRTFMAMEYLDGHTLRNEIDTKGIIPVQAAVDTAIEILQGLAHAHKKGVIHRDIKPDNIQILSNGEIKITDFGIARITFQPNLTMDGQVFGTPSYMSPEQVVGKEIDARSDLFSLATVLYEMLSGQKPFAGDSVVSITYAIMNKEPVQPAQIPYKLWQVVQRALEKSPAARFASAEDLISALQDAVKSPTQTTASPPMPDPFGLSANPYAHGPTVGAPPVVVTNPYGANPQSIAQPGISHQPYGSAPPTYPAAAYPGAGFQGVITPGATYPGAMTPGPTYPAQSYPGAMGPSNQSPGVGHVPSAYPGHYPGMHPNSMPPPANLPQYYPPQPRTPLLSTEQWAFMKRLLVTFLLVGTLLLLVTVAVQALASAWQQYAMQENDRQLVAKVLQQDPQTPIRERIENTESARNRAVSPAAKEQLARTLATLYEELGKQHIARNEDPQAENALIRASSLDARNSSHFASLAALYQERAQNEREPTQRVELLHQSGEQWEKAARAEYDPNTRREFFEQSALLYYTEAAEIVQLNDPALHSRARQALYSAQSAVPSTSQLGQQIQNLLGTLRS